jgi:hypothetical protein
MLQFLKPAYHLDFQLFRVFFYTVHVFMISNKNFVSLKENDLKRYEGFYYGFHL